MRQPPTMLVHHLRVTDEEVFVAATSQERWDWEFEDGAASAVNATDLVWVILRRRPGLAVSETVGFFPGRDTPERAAALDVIPAMLDLAWQIVDEGWDAEQAYEHLDRHRLSSPSTDD